MLISNIDENSCSANEKEPTTPLVEGKVVAIIHHPENRTDMELDATINSNQNGELLNKLCNIKPTLIVVSKSANSFHSSLLQLTGAIL